ncbi:hypothetical protein TURU_046317 [Turdus rufiventris]|nr:hypothetical protein TURU_046317 [Turdus rufiventris]
MEPVDLLALTSLEMNSTTVTLALLAVFLVLLYCLVMVNNSEAEANGQKLQGDGVETPRHHGRDHARERAEGCLDEELGVGLTLTLMTPTVAIQAISMTLLAHRFQDFETAFGSTKQRQA